MPLFWGGSEKSWKELERKLFLQSLLLGLYVKNLQVVRDPYQRTVLVLDRFIGLKK